MTSGLAVAHREAWTCPVLPSKSVTKLSIKPFSSTSVHPVGSVQAPQQAGVAPGKYSMVHPASCTVTVLCCLLAWSFRKEQ